ncbi:MAG: hypothetical protein FD145_951 [Candidatus Saganbacteria bacterium]|uniref:SH3 domain-containing protein n=1 Tax=Candidatus Saganbacteria bacterium TaxID=2575572 RepID=A0A833L0S9_UNCSA|nr:MAG: hypothetical protein FD145_951 [Candidatus Saganbacteria bacterium]
MKKALIIFLFFAILIGIFAPCLAENTPNELQVKKMYSSPTFDSKLVYEIPIEVKLLEISEDANWYKVKIQFYFGPACFKYTGWAYIPVGQALAARNNRLVSSK